MVKRFFKQNYVQINICFNEGNDVVYNEKVG
jgi:hypothetical protein